MPVRKLIALWCVASLLLLPVRTLAEPPRTGMLRRAAGAVVDEFRMLGRCQFSFRLLVAGIGGAAIVAWRYTVGQQQKHQEIVDAGKVLGVEYP